MSDDPDASNAQAALRALHAQLRRAIESGETGDGSPALVRELNEIYDEAFWCRDAALELTRERGRHEWPRISQETGVPIPTLQSRLKAWLISPRRRA